MQQVKEIRYDAEGTEPQRSTDTLKHMTRYSLGIRQRTKTQYASSQDRDDIREKKEYLVAVFLILEPPSPHARIMRPRLTRHANVLIMEPQISGANQTETYRQTARNKRRPDRFSRGSFYACDVKDTAINMGTFFNIDTNDLIGGNKTLK